MGPPEREWCPPSGGPVLERWCARPLSGCSPLWEVAAAEGPRNYEGSPRISDVLGFLRIARLDLDFDLILVGFWLDFGWSSIRFGVILVGFGLVPAWLWL